jgi:hypothetical protein
LDHVSENASDVSQRVSCVSNVSCQMPGILPTDIKLTSSAKNIGRIQRKSMVGSKKGPTIELELDLVE